MTSAYKEQNVLTNLVITNWGKGVLQIGANAYYKLGQLFYYKLGKGLLQIRAGITTWGKVYYKLGQVLQIGAKFITNWGRYYKLEQIITNWGTTLKVIYVYRLEFTFLFLSDELCRRIKILCHVIILLRATNYFSFKCLKEVQFFVFGLLILIAKFAKISTPQVSTAFLEKLESESPVKLNDLWSNTKWKYLVL